MNNDVTCYFSKDSVIANFVKVWSASFDHVSCTNFAIYFLLTYFFLIFTATQTRIKLIWVLTDFLVLVHWWCTIFIIIGTVNWTSVVEFVLHLTGHILTPFTVISGRTLRLFCFVAVPFTTSCIPSDAVFVQVTPTHTVFNVEILEKK